MKRNFRYITKFEEETRSALETREMFTASYYKPIVESYFHNVGVIYEESEVTKQDDKNATSSVEVKVYFGGRSEIIPSGMPCIPATNQPDGRWVLDYESPKGKKLMRELAKKLGDPNRRSSSARLETRRKGTDVIGYTYDADVHSVKDTKKDFADEIKQSKGRKDMNGIPDDLEDFDGNPVHPIFESDELSELDRAILNQRSSSARLETRDWAKAGELDEVGARELYLFTDNESKLQNQQKSIITNLARKFAKGLYDKDLAIKLWTYLADSASKLYSNDNGAQFTPATRRETARMLEELHFSSVQDEAIDYKKRSTSAQLEKRGWFGGDDEDEGKPMLRRKDFLRQVQQIIDGDGSMDDNIYEVTREHAKNGKSKPQFNNDFYELFEQLFKEATKQVIDKAKQDGMSINDDDGDPLETTTDEEIRLFGNIGYPSMIDDQWKDALKEAEED